MPQLDTLTYFSVYAYLVLTYVAVYIFVTLFIIPRLSTVLKVRQKMRQVLPSASSGKTKLNSVLIIEKGWLWTSVKSDAEDCLYTPTRVVEPLAGVYKCDPEELKARCWKGLTSATEYSSESEQHLTPRQANIGSSKAIVMADMHELLVWQRKLRNNKVLHLPGA